jgi:hypothetical protein
MGLFLLVPLGDLIERRRIITIQFTVLAAALPFAAAAPATASLIVASLCTLATDRPRDKVLTQEHSGRVRFAPTTAIK